MESRWFAGGCNFFGPLFLEFLDPPLIAVMAMLLIFDKEKIKIWCLTTNDVKIVKDLSKSDS